MAGRWCFICRQGIGNGPATYDLNLIKMIKKTGPFKEYLFSAAPFWLALAFILFVLNSIKTRSLPNLETLLSVSAILLVVVPLLGGLFYLQARSGQRSRRIVLDRSPFTDFLANGFDVKDDSVVGIVRGYTVIINYEWHPQPNIELKYYLIRYFWTGNAQTLNWNKSIIQNSTAYGRSGHYIGCHIL
jgi:hypothetical protein